MQTDRSIARSLTWRYVTALSLVAMLTTAAWLSLHLVIAKQQSTAAIVNVSGRQRMLSQRTALFSVLLVHGPQASRSAIRAQLREAAALMEKSHHSLILGDAEMGLPGTMSATVRAMYFSAPMALNEQVETYLSKVQALLQVPDKQLRPDNPDLKYIVEMAPGKLVQSLDRMVLQYQIEGEAAVKRLQAIETAVWGVTLLLLALEALLIFHPFTRHIRLVIGKLEEATLSLRMSQDELESRVRQRTADLEQKGRELAHSEERFRLVSASAKDAILIIDQSEAIIYWNAAATTLFGYAADEVLGRNMHELLAPPRYRADIARGYAHFRETGDGPMIGQTIEVTALRKGGEEFPIELSISRLRLDERLSAVGIARDISERKRLENELRLLATTDPLTGLLNRRQFMANFEEQLALLDRRVIREVAVLMADVDHFKRVNDTYGHVAGDALLRHIAQLMQGCLRKIDTLGRIGGEEFAFLLPGTGVEGARDFAERLRQAVEQSSLAYNAASIAVTISIGITIATAADSEPDPVLSRADRALYRAKMAGRNRVEVAAGEV